jgi:hypothetical protein
MLLTIQGKWKVSVITVVSPTPLLRKAKQQETTSDCHREDQSGLLGIFPDFYEEVFLLYPSV